MRRLLILRRASRSHRLVGIESNFHGVPIERRSVFIASDVPRSCSRTPLSPCRGSRHVDLAAANGPRPPSCGVSPSFAGRWPTGRWSHKTGDAKRRERAADSSGVQPPRLALHFESSFATAPRIGRGPSASLDRRLRRLPDHRISITSAKTAARPNRMPATVCSRLARDSRFSIVMNGAAGATNVAGIVWHQVDQAHDARGSKYDCSRPASCRRLLSMRYAKSAKAESSRRCRASRQSGAGDSRIERTAPGVADRPPARRRRALRTAATATVGSSFENPPRPWWLLFRRPST